MIVTQHTDNKRTGANLNEVILTPDNIVTGFGKMFELPVVGAVYAQPLIVSGLTIANQVRNVLYVATMHNRVYAFDADTPQSALWERWLEPSIQLQDPEIGPQPNPPLNAGYKDIEWEVGILSTPVIDTDRAAIYLVSTTKPSTNTYQHHLWKLDLTTGANLSPPALIAGSSGTLVFNGSKQVQRSALLLANNRIYLCFASYGDRDPYNGWVFSFDAGTLALVNSLCTTPNPVPPPLGSNGEGGIWQAGQGPAADDSGNVYVITGNGDFDPTKNNFGMSVLKLDANLNVLDYFAPYNEASLSSNDQDLGSGGVLVIPNANFITGGGKTSILYLMDINHLGGYDGVSDHVVDQIAVNPPPVPPPLPSATHHIHGSPAFWAGADGPRIYVWTENDQCKAYQFLGSSFDHTPTAESTITDPCGVPGGSSGMPGGFLTISANGSQDGILWASHPWKDDLNQKIGEGVLRAFDPLTLQQKWFSRNNQPRDDFGNFAKFCPPTVANGKVYMATMGGLSHKVTLPESALGGPALAKWKDYALIVGWSGTDGHLNINTSTDGINWQTKVTIQTESTPNALSLAFDNSSNTSRIFLAWTGQDTRLNVMSSTDRNLQSWTAKSTSVETSSHGPALLFVNGRLFLAWTGTDSHLNVMSSADLGASWQNKITSSETSGTEPALAFWNGSLILLWTGTDGRLNFEQSGDGGLTWGNKITLGDTSSNHPAMAIASDGIAWFSWAGQGLQTPNQINILNSENGMTSGFQASPNYKRTFDDTAANGPALCELGGQMFIAWAGTDPGNHVNVGRLNRGAVAVYGHYHLSLLKLARSLQTNTASGIVTGLGRKWPPPPPISVRSLFV